MNFDFEEDWYGWRLRGRHTTDELEKTLQWCGPLSARTGHRIALAGALQRPSGNSDSYVGSACSH